MTAWLSETETTLNVVERSRCEDLSCSPDSQKQYHRCWIERTGLRDDDELRQPPLSFIRT